MAGNTGLLTARCDPYGAESEVQLLGGVHPASMQGRIHWHCEQTAVARFRMICTGGGYGTRTAPDGGPVYAYHCPGGHRGQIMALCKDHRLEIARRQSDLCPACAYPPDARSIAQEIEAVQYEMTRPGLGSWSKLAQLTLRHNHLAEKMTELRDRGLIHKCPLRLTEVS